MSKTKMVLRRIAGSLVGLLIGGALLGLLGWLLAIVSTSGMRGDPDTGIVVFFLVIGLCLLSGTILGAAAGASRVHGDLGQKGSFWKALVGAFVGLLVGVFLSFALSDVVFNALYRMGLGPGTLVRLHLDTVVELLVRFLIIDTIVVAGAVIGSGWRAKPAAKAQG